jgi:outer membrane protein assembly factor BamB
MSVDNTSHRLQFVSLVGECDSEMVVGVIFTFSALCSAVLAGAPPPFEKLWSTSIPAAPSAIVLDADGDTLFFGGADGYGYALDAFSGAVNWKTPLRAPTSCAPLLLANESKVLFVSEDGTLNLINASTGAAINQTVKLGDSPVQDCYPVYDALTNAILVTNVNSYSLHVREASTLARRWLGSASSIPMLRGDGFAYVGEAGGYIYQYNLTDGNDSGWTFSGPDSNYHRPIYARGTFMLTSEYLFLRVDETDTSQVWTYNAPTLGSDVVFMSSNNETVVFGTSTGSLVSLHAFLGQVNWIVNTTNNAPIVTTPTVSNGAILVGDAYGGFYAFATDGSGITAFTNLTAPLPNYAQPAVSAKYGAVFLGSAAGTIVALGIGSATLPPSPSTIAPIANGILADVCFQPNCMQCEQTHFAPGCVASSLDTSMNRVCNGKTYNVTYYRQSTNCSSKPQFTQSFQVGTCYPRDDGTTFAVSSCDSTQL